MSRSIISRGALRQVDCRLVQLTCPNATLRVLAGGHSCGGEAAIHPGLKGSSSSSSNIGRYCPSAELSCGCRSRLTGTGGKRQCETWIFWVCCTNHTRRFLIGEWLFISNFLLTTFSPSLSLPLTSSEHTPRGPDMPIAQQPTAGPEFIRLFYCWYYCCYGSSSHAARGCSYLIPSPSRPIWGTARCRSGVRRGRFPARQSPPTRSPAMLQIDITIVPGKEARGMRSSSTQELGRLHFRHGCGR